ncbi:MAG: HIT family protein [Acidimicrobiia bacterium]|nr:HIT family protein [Acidimicrobiia bacterium]
MPSVFTLILKGDLPGHFVYRDDACAAFMSIAPLKPGHTLVVPVTEVDHWPDLDEKTLTHLTRISQKIARAIDAAFSPVKVAMMVVGLEVPHVHVHLVPIESESDVNFANATPATSEELAAAASLIRSHLNE